MGVPNFAAVLCTYGCFELRAGIGSTERSEGMYLKPWYTRIHVYLWKLGSGIYIDVSSFRFEFRVCVLRYLMLL